MVFPEGARGTAKLFRERNSLVEFGSRVRAPGAEDADRPSCPFAVLGGGEAFPTIANAYTLGRLFGVPVPSHRRVRPADAASGQDRHRVRRPPCIFAGTGNEEDAVVHGYVDKVKEVIAKMVDAGARRRRGEPPPQLTEGS